MCKPIDEDACWVDKVMPTYNMDIWLQIWRYLVGEAAQSEVE